MPRRVQEALLHWFAGQDRAARAAGVAPMQLYIHTDGDSTDYTGINPVTTEAQDDAIEAAARKRVSGGAQASMELRKYIASHTDTFTIGPITADRLLARLNR